MADVVLSVGARDESGRALRRTSRNLQRTARSGETAFNRFGRAAGQSLRAVALGVGAVTAGMVALGGAAAAAYGRVLQGAVESATELRRTALATGANVEALQVYRTALEEVGRDIDDVQGAISGMNDFLQEAADGTEDAVNTLAILGVTLEQLQTQTPDQQLLTLGTALNNLEDAGTRAALAHRIMGEDFEKLQPIFTLTAEQLDDVRMRTNLLSQENLQTAAVIRQVTADIGTAFHSMALDAAQSFIEMAQANQQAAVEIVGNFDRILLYLAQDWQGAATLITAPLRIARNQASIILQSIVGEVSNVLGRVFALLARLPGAHRQRLGEISGAFSGFGAEALGARDANIAVNQQIRDAQRHAQTRRDIFDIQYEQSGRSGPLTNILQGLLDRTTRATPPSLPGPGTGLGPSTFRPTVAPEVDDDEPERERAEREARRRRSPRARVVGLGSRGPSRVQTQNFEFTFNYYGDVEREDNDERIITQIQKAFDRGRLRVAI